MNEPTRQEEYQLSAADIASAQRITESVFDALADADHSGFDERTHDMIFRSVAYRLNAIENERRTMLEDARFFCFEHLDTEDKSSRDYFKTKLSDYVNRITTILSRGESAYKQQNEQETDIDEKFGKKLGDIIESIAKRAPDKITLVLEEYHIDPSYRDLYYHHYSNQFFDTQRYSLRINFFIGALSEYNFSGLIPEASPGILSTKELCNRFIGSCVIDPIKGGVIGRTLLSPKYFINEKDTIQVRLSEFETTVMGRRLKVSAFPFRMQDGETLRCAEISLLNLMCYYSNEYNDYSKVLPSDIIEAERQYAPERVTPARGVDHYTLTKMLTNFGFHPRIYGIKNIENDLISGERKEWMFQRLLHWYIRAGIPVVVNANPPSEAGGHSVVCMGYRELDNAECSRYAKALSFPDGTKMSASEISKPLVPQMPDIESIYLRSDLLNKALTIVDTRSSHGAESSDIESSPEQVFCSVILSADFYTNYVVMDDGRLPYGIAQQETIAQSFPTMRTEFYSVPLHRGMALDALDAYNTFKSILTNEHTGIIQWGVSEGGTVPGTVREGENVVMDMFLASSRSYKRFRVHNGCEDEERPVRAGSAQPEMSATYGTVPLPHFVWVAELFHVEDFFVDNPKQRQAFAEIVLDATSGGEGDSVSRIIFMRYGERIAFRFPDAPPLEDWTDPKSDDDPSISKAFRKFRSFDKNLTTITAEEQT